MTESVDCANIITSEDYADFIVKRSERVLESYKNDPNACVEIVNADWMIVHAPYSKEAGINVGTSGYFRIPKLLTVMDTTSMEASGITAVQNQPALDLRGQGVIIGFVDTGVDYTNQVFQFTRNRSKIEAIWDQTQPWNADNTEIHEQYPNVHYGNIYTNEQINQALEAKERGEDPYNIVPTTDDAEGHGTFMAGIAAGRSIDEQFIGAAPDATILMVKLKPAKTYLRDFYLIKKDAIAYQANDVMMGVRFLLDYANKAKKPLVICIGLGTNMGPHSIGTPLGIYLNSVANTVGVVVVTCTGNETDKRHHYSGLKNDDQTFIPVEVFVGENSTGFTLELWGKSPELFSVAIVSPSGEEIQRMPIRSGSSNIINFIFDRSIISLDYRVVEVLSGDELVLMRFQFPTQGIWTIRVYGISGITGVFNMWLPVEGFLNTDTYFIESSPYTTLTEPSPATQTLTVAGYEHQNMSLFVSSGRGYTADGRVKPDLAAPAVNVYGPAPGGRFVYRTGTSIAAAHVAGAAALLLTWGVVRGNNSLMSTSTVKNILIRGARRDNSLTYPNREWGYGELDLIQAFERLSQN